MSRFAHHASRRVAEVESEFVHARYIVVPALLWVVAILALTIVAAFQEPPASGSDQTASPEVVPIAPFGA